MLIAKRTNLRINVKSGASGNEVDAISSATITSKAVTDGVNNAIELVEKYKEGDK